MKLIATIAATAALAVSAPAFAGSIAVEYKDLDLTTEQGQKTLETRVNSAAREVCGMNDHRTGTRIASSDARACYNEAREQLSKKIAAVVAKENRARMGG